MKYFVLVTAFVVSASFRPAYGVEPIAGESTIGVSVAVVQALAYGWSAKKDVLGKAVYNDKNEKIGSIQDLIIAPDKAVSYGIIGTGGFLGMAKHDVAISADKLKKGSDGKFVLAGATKETLKAMPEFEYARSQKAE